MSRTCQRCGYENDDQHFFCQQCGEPLDADVRVIMGYEKMKKAPSSAPKAAARKDDDDDFVFVRKERKKKSYTALWVVLACLVVAGVFAAYYLLR